MPEVEGEELQAQPGESEQETTTAEESGTSDHEQDNQQPEPKKEVSDGVQKRIDKLTAQRRDAERRLAELERKLAEKDNQPSKAAEPNTKPTPDKYPTYEEYVEALTDYKTEQKFAAKQAEAAKAKEAEKLSTVTKEWNESVKAAQKAHADYEDAFQEAAEEIENGERTNFPASTFNAIMETDSKAEILYYLAKNRADHEALAKATGNRVLIELGKTEAKLAGSGTVQDKPKVTNAPKPPSAVGGRAKGSFDPNDPNVPIDEWMKRERERSQKR